LGKSSQKKNKSVPRFLCTLVSQKINRLSELLEAVTVGKLASQNQTA
jgi:hypothetical protein